MPLILRNIPGFSDVADSELDAGKTARGYTLGKISSNAAFGMVRTEFFMGLYHDGDTVILPTSPVDGYPYSREELSYSWMVQSSLNPSTGWITGPDCLWYAAWLVNQADGKVYCEEWYRRSSSSNPNPTKSNDGTLMVFTFAQRIKNPSHTTIVPNFPEMPLSNIAAIGGTSVLRVKSSAIKQRFRKAIFSFHSSDTVIPYTVQKCTFLKTPANDPATILETIDVLFGGSPTYAAALGEVFECDPIETVIDPGFDYYIMVYETTLANGRVNGNAGVPNNLGNIATGFLAGDRTDGTLLDTLNVDSDYWRGFASLRFSDTASLAEFTIIDDGSFYQDRPLNTSLVKTMNRNAKISIFSSEVIHMGEFVDGDQVPQPVSTYDGHAYDYSDVFFMHSWRWTPDGSNFVSPPAGVAGLPSFLQPSKDLGQLDRLNALVDATGNVAIDVQYKGSGAPAHAPGHGRLMVTAFCQRHGFSEVS